MPLLVCSRMLWMRPAAKPSAALRAAFEARMHAIGLHSLHLEGISLATDEPAPVLQSPGALTVVHVDPGKRRGSRLQRLLASGVSVAALARDVEIYNLAHLDGRGARFSGDALGLLPLYQARIPEGTVVASRVLDLLTLWPELAQPIDETALRELLGFGYPLCGRTLHARIQRLPPGTMVELPSDGAGIKEWPAQEMASPPESAARDDTIDWLGEAIETAVRERLPQGDVWMGLTGGFDSRVLLGALTATRAPVLAVTYGAEHHAEVAVARAVARRAKVAHRVVPILPTNVRDALERAVEAQEATARPIVTLSNLVPVASTTPPTFLHGFLGDALGGANLSKWAAGRPITDHEQAAAIVLEANWRWHPSYEAVYGLAEDRYAVREDLQRGLANHPADYRAVVQWDLAERQRRLIASHFRVLSEHYDVCLPYYAPEVLARYLALPREWLENRKATRCLLRRRYRDLANVRHDEEFWPLRPSLRGALAACRLALTHRPGLLRHFAPHGEVIWAVSGREVNGARQEFVDTIHSREPALASLLPGMPPLRREAVAAMPAGALLQLRHLCDYAAAVARHAVE